MGVCILKRLISLLLCIWMLLSLCACGQSDVPPQQEPPDPPSAEKEEENTPPPVEVIPFPEPAPDPVGDLIASMTLEEKVGQLFFVRCPAENAVEDIQTYHLGGYLLFGRDFKDKTANEIIQTIAAYQDAACRKSEGAEIPLLIGVDEEGGTVVRVSSNPHLRSSRFKSPQKVLATPFEPDPNVTYNLAALEDDTREKCRLLKALGINVNLAPVVDVATNPNSFIYDRTFGVDAPLTGEAALTVVETMSGSNMGSVLKHFPGYGDNEDTHTGIAVDSRPAETFTTDGDLFPFLVHYASQGKTAVLVSHNIIESIDPHLPASLSPAVHDLLREEVEFNGVAMTDDLAMEAVAAYAEDGAVAVMAIEAGNDIVLTTDYRTQIPKVLEAVASGRLPEEAIDTACRRVLEWKSALGLLSF